MAVTWDWNYFNLRFVSGPGRLLQGQRHQDRSRPLILSLVHRRVCHLLHHGPGQEHPEVLRVDPGCRLHHWWSPGSFLAYLSHPWRPTVEGDTKEISVEATDITWSQSHVKISE